VVPLKPNNLSDKIFNVSFDTEYTQDLEKRDGTLEQLPKLIFDQQLCSKCEAVNHLCPDCVQYGKGVHEFWQETVGNFVDYLRQSRHLTEKIYVI